MVNSPEGDLQYSPEGLHEYSKDLPRGSIHHDTTEAFPQIFILAYLLDQFICTGTAPALVRMRGAGTSANGGPQVVSYRMVRRRFRTIVSVKSHYSGTVVSKNVECTV